MADDTPAATDTATETTEEPVQVEVSSGGAAGGYCKRQVGLIGILTIIMGVANAGYIAQGNYGAAINVILYILWGLGYLWIEVADKGDHLLVASGPCRWAWCGWGKEKVKYSEIRDYEITKTCWLYTPGQCCTGVRIMNQCSCCQCGCCGPAGSMVGGCCSQRTVRLTVNERMMGHGAGDDNDCFLEKCCLANCFGEVCVARGMGLCFQPCCNPCKVNCCAMNTMYVSTNDAEGLVALLNNKTGKNVTVTADL